LLSSLINIIFHFIHAQNKLQGYFKEIKDIGLSCRNLNDLNVQRIKGKYSKPIVYMSVGRSVNLQKEIDLEGLPYQFVYTEGIKLKGKNTELLPVNTDSTHDYINAADYVITKAGWGTVAEAICARKPMLVLRRDEVVEDRVTLKKLVELGIALPISTKDLNANYLSGLLRQLETMRENYKNLSSRYYNCSDKIAEQVLEYLHGEAVQSGKNCKFYCRP